MGNEKKSVTRRQFLKGSATGLGTGLAIWNGLASARILGANDRIRIGGIGTGGRAQYLLELLKKLPGTELVGVCDVYQPKMVQAAQIGGAGTKQYLDYRAMLDNKEIDAVVIGSPDHWHKQMTIDAVRAGKDVYVEKPISHSIEEGVEMVRAVEASGRVVQTGTQQRSWEHYLLGKQIVDSGKLGQINFVYTFWYQNYAETADWRDFRNIQPDKLDWKQWLGSAPNQAFSPEKYVLWRWYWDFGGGALTDLMTHWIDVIQWYMGIPVPTTALANGNRYIQSWDCPDTITCVLEYPKNYTVTYNGSMASDIDDGGIEFRGTRGTLKIDREHLAFYSEESKEVPGTNSPEPEILVRSSGDGTRTHLANFLDCVKSRKTPTAGIRVAHEAARASHLGNLALKLGHKIRWNAQQERVES
jgi:predicted dehydrogenase